MRVLIVCSGNQPNFKFEIHQAFVYDQVNSLKRLNHSIDFFFFFIKRKGFWGYLSYYRELKSFLKKNKIELIHAHFVFSGLLANLQRKVPVICSYHGTDINNSKNRIFSFFVSLLSKKIIVVSKDLKRRSFFKNKNTIIPCGVDTDIFKPIERENARSHFKLDTNQFYILFSSSFNNAIKNYKLLEEALPYLKELDPHVIELKNFKREEVSKLMSAVDVSVMTSLSEGSPQFIKEAMACSCPIVSTNVGDVKWVIAKTEGCFIANNNAKDVALKIRLAYNYSKTIGKTDGNLRIIELGLDSKRIASLVINIYQEIINPKKAGR